MRTLHYIEKPVQNKYKFTFSHIYDAVFHKKSPTILIYPFENLKNSDLKRISIPISLYIYNNEDNLFSLFEKVVVFDKNISLTLLKKLPLWALLLIYNEYKKAIDNWIDYLFDNINSFCDKDSESIINWSIVDKGGISLLMTSPLTFEQKLWVSICSKIDKNDLIKLIVEIKDSLLPWINNDLYNKVMDKKENTRENVAYEAQRQKLQEGKLEDLDIIL